MLGPYTWQLCELEPPALDFHKWTVVCVSPGAPPAYPTRKEGPAADTLLVLGTHLPKAKECLLSFPPHRPAALTEQP